MNGLFNTGLTFWQLIIAILTITFSIITIKIAVSFDINKYLKRKDERLERKMKNVCPHVKIRQEDNSHYSIRSLMESPMGTHKWQCQRRGLIRNHNNDYEKQYEYWNNNIDEYVERVKQFERLLKKGGAL
jgi:hypothetical protein